MFFPIVGKGFVKFAIFFLRDIIGIASPDGLGLVNLFIFGVFLLDSFLFLFVLVLLVGIFVFADVFNFGFVLVLFFLHLFFFGFIVGHLLVAFLFDKKLDGITNKLRMFLHNILDSAFFVVFHLIFFQMQNDLGTTAQRFGV